MKFVVDVEPKRFDAFAIACPLNHYSKTSPFIAFKKEEYQSGNLLGVEDEEGNLIATALMLHRRIPLLGMQFSYVQYGFNLAIENRDLIAYFAKQLKEYAKAKGSIFLRMDFNIPRLEHDKNGKVVENGFNHEYITEILKENGYTHLGYNYGYSGNWMSRFTYRLDLNRPFSEIKKGIKRYQTYHNKNEMRGVAVHPATQEDLAVLIQSQKELSAKLGFKPNDVSYFKKLWDCYEGNVYYYIVDTNYHQAKLNLQKEIDNLEMHLQTLKDENKKEITQKNIQALEKEIHEIENHGLDIDERKVLGAKFIIKLGENVWNVNMYTLKTLLNFRGAFALHDYAIQDMIEKGAKTYDFEGISGSMDPSDEYWGQTDFKKSFGGDYLEFLGEFDAIFDEKKYAQWKKARSLYSRVRRKLRFLKYKK
ncbi:MAG: peptidoglycan bridge formation glycyltransferase FemA/FemB family protein [Solobacterium sp.]|nr:peptidoglycan bridge formation glycyltransferase FemA/FemB family protein [Solobacterium sp.]